MGSVQKGLGRGLSRQWKMCAGTRREGDVERGGEEGSAGSEETGLFEQGREGGRCGAPQRCPGERSLRAPSASTLQLQTGDGNLPTSQGCGRRSQERVEVRCSGRSPREAVGCVCVCGGWGREPSPCTRPCTELAVRTRPGGRATLMDHMGRGAHGDTGRVLVPPGGSQGAGRKSTLVCEGRVMGAY